MDLRVELNKRVDIFNQEMKSYIGKGVPEILYDAARHLPFAGGKRLRPCISMLSCESLSGDVSRVMPLAVAIELIHNFTLVHDDIMDRSELRRGLPTVHKKYGEPTAIIAGDLLFTMAFEVMHDIYWDPSIFKKLEFGLVSSIREVCEGQQLDMSFETRKNVTRKEYLEMISKKTAALFKYSAEGGAIVGNGSPEEVESLGNYGLYLGLAFQIRDDFLDMSSETGILGKDIGNDIRNGKKTLIAVHAFDTATGKDKKVLEKIFGNINSTEEDVHIVFNLFKKLKSIEYAGNTALEYSKKAKKELDILVDSNAKQILLDLAEYSIKREK